jgi:serine/threonine protein kinase
MELRVGGKFNITKKLGMGSFGEIFAGINVKTGEEIAVKLEPVYSERPILHYEALLVKKLSGYSKNSSN